MKRARSIAAVACVVFAALLPAIGLPLQLASMPDWYRPRDDPLSHFERRFTGLRDALRGEPVVGYVSPEPLDAAARRAHLYMTRYTLAPTVVRNNLQQRLVVADLVPNAAQLPPQLTVRRHFGGGLFLLERTGE